MASIILLAVLLVFSALVSVGQALFQISLATGYTLTACELIAIITLYAAPEENVV